MIYTIDLVLFYLATKAGRTPYYWTCVIGAVFKSHEFRELHESKLV